MSRKSAEERREELVRIGIEHFAVTGYVGTSTEAIARDAGISQPYLFRLFKTKRELFLACHAEMHERIRRTFTAAADGGLETMGRAYMDLLDADHRALLFQMQSYAACSDPVIQEVVRERYGELVKLVTHVSGAPAAEVWRFFAHGMLLNVTASLDLGAIADREEWAYAWSQPVELIGLG